MAVGSRGIFFRAAGSLAFDCPLGHSGVEVAADRGVLLSPSRPVLLDVLAAVVAPACRPGSGWRRFGKHADRFQVAPGEVRRHPLRPFLLRTALLQAMVSWCTGATSYCRQVFVL